MEGAAIIATLHDRVMASTCLDRLPLKRLTADDDMAGAAIYLASRAGAYLTGAVVPVDGG